MKLISKNAELIIVLIIIFFIYFTLTLMYESKIDSIKDNMVEESDCISEDSLYFPADDNNQYIVNITILEKITDNYIKVLYNDITTVIELNSNIVDNLVLNNLYILTIDNTSNTSIVKNDLQALINTNKLVSLEVRG